MDAPLTHITVTFDKVRDLIERDLGSSTRIFLLAADSVYVATAHTFEKGALGNLLLEWMEKEKMIDMVQDENGNPLC